MKLGNLIIVVLAAASLMGCGRSNLVYNDNVDAGHISTDGLSIFPPGFYNQSVNKASVDLATSSGAKVVRFKTNEGFSLPGAFNDSTRTGNYALLGISLFDQTSLSQISEIGFESRQILGTRPLDILLQVDLECDGSLPYVLRALGSDLYSTSASNGYVSFSVLLTEAAWTSNGTAIMDGMTVVVPESDSGNGLASIDTLLSSYPNACLVNGQTFDPTLAKSLPTAGVLIGLGDADHTSLEEVYVRNIKVDSTTYSTWE